LEIWYFGQKMKKNFISRAILETLEHRKRFLEVILTVAVLSTGINLICTYFTAGPSQQSPLILYIGLTCTLLPLLSLFLNLCVNRKRKALIETVFCLNNNDNVLTKILGYKFSTNLSDVFKAGFIENIAWKKLWDDDPIIRKTNNLENFDNVVSIASQKGEDAKFIQKTEVSTAYSPITKASTLLVEGIEFMILELLSIHLNDYFRQYNSDKAKEFISEFDRSDFSRLLLDNRFLSLFSTSLENRHIFAEVAKKNLNSNVTEIRGFDGSYYKKFKLILPRETTIERPALGCIELKNARFKLKIKIKYENYNYNLPDGFEQAYIGVAPAEITTKKVKLEIENEVNLVSLLNFKNWQYYSWLDSFIEELYNQFSFEEFLTQINWSTVSTLLHTQQTLSMFLSTQNKK